ncbi:MAG TPA: NAD(P)/FAD-dependent oxidoreductase [Gammaproteobacteria bacterium]|nr:NAD(P)/FAD-dependent oxidoreductase [Gammaproteobacteria bacterium]
MADATTPPRIVVIGGGAGGLELVSRLGRTLGRQGRARITLVDGQLTHLWKPLLHEVAAGTLDSQQDDLDYIALARWRNFEFLLGRFDGLDRRNRQVHIAETRDENGKVIIPPRNIPYDLLVIAVGSVTNDFGTPGVREHCMFLDSREQADVFQRRLLENYMRAQTQTEPLRDGQLNVAIVGAGATGVELAAELHHVTRQMVAYGFDRIVPEKDVTISIFEAGQRILPALHKRIAKGAAEQLQKLNVQIHTGARIARATAEGLYSQDGIFFPAEMKVWAAGIKAPDFLKDIGGLETNRLNQLVVRPTLQTTRDENIFAFGDCASCPLPDNTRPAPPTAQAAHQQASLLVKSLARRLEGKPLPDFVYRDHGSLVSLSEYSAIGNLMGNLLGDIRLEGWIARRVYRALYRQHQRALYGPLRTFLVSAADLLSRRTRPRMKLH